MASRRIFWGTQRGAILSLAAARRATQLRSLILYEPPFIVEGARARPGAEVLEEMQRLLAAGESDQALRIAMRETVALMDAEIDVMQSQPGWEHLREAARAIPSDWKIWDERFVPAQLAAVRTPTLLLEGSESPGWIRASTEAVGRALPNARLVEMEGQGHSAMITNPGLFTDEVVRFASGVG